MGEDGAEGCHADDDVALHPGGETSHLDIR